MGASNEHTRYVNQNNRNTERMLNIDTYVQI